MKNESIQCRRYCEKTGECLLDKIDSWPLGVDELVIVEDLKVVFPRRAKAFQLVENDAKERMSEEFCESYDYKEETFIWSDSVDCSKSVLLGKYGISTEIRLDDTRTTVYEVEI
jgi:hypothetical protein